MDDYIKTETYADKLHFRIELFRNRFQNLKDNIHHDSQLFKESLMNFSERLKLFGQTSAEEFKKFFSFLHHEFHKKHYRFKHRTKIQLLIISGSALVVGITVYYFMKRSQKKSFSSNSEDYYLSREQLINVLTDNAIQPVNDIELKAKQLVGNYNNSNFLKKPVSLSNKSKIFRKEREQELEALQEFIESKLDVYPPILFRPYKTVFKSNSEETKSQFSIMQWNALAKNLCKGNSEAFDWNFRMWRIMEELVRYDCDIICLEEADFYEDIKPYLHNIGYSSTFCPKYSPALVKSNFDPDGCAIFYKTDKFQITQLRCQSIYLNNEHNNQVFIIIQLKHKYTRKRVTLVCVHLKAYNDYLDTRLEQIKFVLGVLREHLKYNQEDIKKQTVILCGDFNGHFNEPFYKLVMSDPDIKFSDINYQYKKDQIDYIFYTNQLKLISYLERVETSEKLPNLTYPSDHLSLVCDFQFT